MSFRLFTTGIFYITAMGLTGCIPEDTTPSSALFPASKSHGIIIRPDFSSQLSQKAPRQDVELHALYGAFFAERTVVENRPVTESLNRGHFKDSQNGKQIYRVENAADAEKILGDAWTWAKWNKDSDLGKRFEMAEFASIAILNNKDQRILFFDQAERLVGVYPQAG